MLELKLHHETEQFLNSSVEKEPLDKRMSTL